MVAAGAGTGAPPKEKLGAVEDEDVPREKVGLGALADCGADDVADEPPREKPTTVLLGSADLATPPIDFGSTGAEPKLKDGLTSVRLVEGAAGCSDFTAPNEKLAAGLGKAVFSTSSVPPNKDFTTFDSEDIRDVSEGLGFGNAFGVSAEAVEGSAVAGALSAVEDEAAGAVFSLSVGKRDRDLVVSAFCGSCIFTVLSGTTSLAGFIEGTTLSSSL